jgi:uncharacterized membrane protein
MSRPSVLLPLLCVVGTITSLYAYHVETQLATPGYVPLCDNALHGWSCSRVFTHPGGHLLSFVGLVPRHSVLDLSSALLGCMFYQFSLAWYLLLRVGAVPALAYHVVALGSSVFSLAITAFMSWIMIAQIKEVCVVCTTMYACNFCIFAMSLGAALAAKSGNNSKRKMHSL